MGAAMAIQKFEGLRRVALGGTGLLCLIYAGGVLVTGRPDPMPFWIPGAAGVVALIVITLGLRMDRRNMSAMDEGYLADWGRAQRHAYWIALWLYPLFGVLLAAGVITFPAAFAAMGTLSGAAVLILFVIYDMRGR
jgi:apolipoprotein N-acyltransferase